MNKHIVHIIALYSMVLQALLDTLNLNSVGPLLMAKHFAPLLQKGQGQFGSCDKQQVSGVLVNMSAKVGSITDNGNCLRTYSSIQKDKLSESLDVEFMILY